jgi:hypothetical protein
MLVPSVVPATFSLPHADAPFLMFGRKSKGSFWHGVLFFETGQFHLQSTSGR